MVADYISTSFAGGYAFPVFVIAKPPTGSVFSERAAAARFDVTAPPPVARIRTRRDKVVYRAAQPSAGRRRSDSQLGHFEASELRSGDRGGERAEGKRPPDDCRGRGSRAAPRVGGLGRERPSVPGQRGPVHERRPGSTRRRSSRTRSPSARRSSRRRSRAGTSPAAARATTSSRPRRTAARTWVTGGLPGHDRQRDPPGPVAEDQRPGRRLRPGARRLARSGPRDQLGRARASCVLVNRSTDGGLTWSNPVTVAASRRAPSGTRRGSPATRGLRAPTTGTATRSGTTTGSGNQMMMSTSTDGGLTWSAPVSLRRRRPGSAASPSSCRTAPSSCRTPRTTASIRAFRSTNGGASWEPGVFVASQTQHGVVGTCAIRRCRRPRSTGPGRVYVVWHDCQFRSGCASNDIVMSTSTDGVTWTPKTRIPIDPVEQHRRPLPAGDRRRQGDLGQQRAPRARLLLLPGQQLRRAAASSRSASSRRSTAARPGARPRRSPGR